ncbi:MAG TPA: DUF2779 domain-containing protein [bacterium]|nr:DUF2779 domain-containing protein [bacterium]
MNKSIFLTKSDFAVARTCPTKLFYLKNHYPNSLQDDEYLELMAEGGYMVGNLAQLMYPDGIEITLDKGIADAIAQTQEQLKKDNVTLFEPIIVAGNKRIRIDILIKNGDRFELIEVKAKSLDPKKPYLNKNGSIASDWRPYFDDVAFQVIILKEAYPHLRITPCLLLVDTTKRANVDNLAGLFEIHKVSSYDEGFRSYDVAFTGNAAEVINNGLLIKIDVTRQIADIWNETKTVVQTLEDSLKNGLKKIATPLSVHCNKCEFRDTDVGPCGFKECWGKLADVTPHIFDLFFGSTIGGSKNPLFNSMIAEGKVSLYEIPLDALPEKRGIRQAIQIKHTRENTEWISHELKEKMDACAYPLHFIDFETTRVPLPFHKGMRPYEQIAFQWSCHTIEKQGADPLHSDWINTKDHFPNFEFAKSLMEQAGTGGTVFMWATHENTVLSDIFRQAQEYGYKDDQLIGWLDMMTKKDKEDSYTMVDMCALARNYYFHPDMKGKTSIKSVLPAVWKNYPNIKATPWLTKYYQADQNGRVLSPYETLPPINIGEHHEVIRDGTQAMRAYNEMMIGMHRHDTATKDLWVALLKQYCELDTLAMVVIWNYWQTRFVKNLM